MSRPSSGRRPPVAENGQLPSIYNALKVHMDFNSRHVILDERFTLFGIRPELDVVIGIDASIANTSYTFGAVDLEASPVFNGTYTLEPTVTDFCENLKGILDSRIFANVFHLVQLLKTLRPIAVGLEDYSYNSKFSGVDLAEQGAFFRAILAYYSEVSGAKVHLYAPTDVKKSFAGTGNASKALMQSTATLAFQEPVLNDNDADSFAIFITLLIKEFGFNFKAKKFPTTRIPLYKIAAKKGKAKEIKNEGILTPPKLLLK
jgi:Holliday junction resolvasome RuvABC endonuclease subunit